MIAVNVVDFVTWVHVKMGRSCRGNITYGGRFLAVRGVVVDFNFVRMGVTEELGCHCALVTEIDLL